MMPLTFVMVCEAQADFQTAAVLTDRVLCENVEWIEPSVIDSYRQFKGSRDDASCLTWVEAARLGETFGRRAHGHFEGKPGDLDALAARRAILVVLSRFPDVQAILLIRDSDGLSGRKEGLEQARAEMSNADAAIVIGVAHCKREAWILAGFEAQDQQERQQIDALRQELGFHPCERSHELDAKHPTDKRSAKRVNALLVRGDQDREVACVTIAQMELLKMRGAQNGLASFLHEVEQRVVPLFKGGTS